MHSICCIYNVEVLGIKSKFAKFANSLTFNDSVANIKTKYKNTTGKDMETVVDKWEDWVLSVDENSDIYMSW